MPRPLKAQLHGSGSTRATKWYGSRDAHIWARARDDITYVYTYNVHTDDVYLANQIHVLKSAGTFQKNGRFRETAPLSFPVLVIQYI